MSHGSLAAVYLAVGIACGALVYARSEVRGPRTVASAAAAVLLWPLWAPFALLGQQRPVAGPFSVRVAKALEEGVSAVAGTCAAAALRHEDKVDLVRRVELAERRLAELDSRILITRCALEGLRRKGPESPQSGPPGEPDMSQRLPAGPSAETVGAPIGIGIGTRGEVLEATLDHIEAVRAREYAALSDLADLCDLLRAQLLLTRLGSSSKVIELRDELLARVQVLNEVAGPPFR